MRLALDARWIFAENSGIGQHTRLLVQGLAALPFPHEALLLFDDAARAERIKADCHCDWPHAILPYPLFSLANQLRLGAWLRGRKVDLYHSTNYLMPLPGFPRHRAGRTRAVVTVHDLIPMRFRDHAPKSRKSRIYPVYERLMLEVGARSDAILTVSEASKADIVELLRLRQPDKVHVVYNGLHARFCPDATVQRRDPPEILYVGRLDPYKNVPLLVRAFAKIRDRLPPGARLRLVGPPDARYPEARQEAQNRQVSPYVEWAGPVDDATLVEAYRRATVLVLASDYEGFGLPVAEAMACGTPVICSDASSLPEVVGDAALRVPAGDEAALGHALRQVLNDESLRAGMAARGRVQAQRFTAAAMARGTLSVYEQTLSKPRRSP